MVPFGTNGIYNGPIEIGKGTSNEQQYGFIKDGNQFIYVVKNINDRVVAVRKNIDDSVYIESEHSKIVNDSAFDFCSTPIYKYLINGQDRTKYTEVEKCEQEEECKLSNNPSDNYGCASGYYLKKADNNEYHTLADEKNVIGILYKCIDVVGNYQIKQCREVADTDEFKPGYYKNVDNSVGSEKLPYIKCDTIDQCVAITVEEENCGSVEAGSLIVDSKDATRENKVYSICINNENSVKLDNDENVQMFISINTDVKAFSSESKEGHFVLVDITENVFRNDVDGKEFKYRYTDLKQKLIKRNHRYINSNKLRRRSNRLSRRSGNTDEGFCSDDITKIKLHEFTQVTEECGDGCYYKQTFKGNDD